MRWFPLDAWDPRVTDRGDWGEPVEEWPGGPGVYVFATERLEVLEVGGGANLGALALASADARGPRCGLWLSTRAIADANALRDRLRLKYGVAEVP